MSEGDAKSEVKPGIGYVDCAITEAIRPTLPCWHAIGATPNVLTTLGLVSSGACVYALYQRKLGWAIMFLVLRCYFDYADGLLARKYKQTSNIGDWYDHIVDVTFSLGVFGVLLFSKYPAKTKAALVGVLVVFFVLFLVQMGCIEREYRKTHAKKEETTISRLRALCPPPGVGVQIINAFDNGTLYIVMGIVFAIFCRQK